MKKRFVRIKQYSLNCFLLTIPIMAWNILLASKLPEPFQPEIFQADIPLFLTIGESVFRMIIFIFTLLMPLSIKTKTQKIGIATYIIGVLFYFASWLALIYYPESKWSSGYLGFMAPAYTPLIWLTGIGLIGEKSYFNLPYIKYGFIASSIIFLISHNIHTLIIYNRIHGH